MFLIGSLTVACIQSHCLAQANHLITCGDDQVMIIDLDLSQDTVPHIIWNWKASEATDLPASYRNRYFRTIDECKCVRGGKQILLTSSSNGVGLLDRASKRVLFYASVGNAHSAELLPEGRIAVMGSTHPDGNRIVLFDEKYSERPLFHDSIYSGHGVVWDPKNKLLYALGYDDLRSYQLANWLSNKPKLTLVDLWKIPGQSGHDLSPWPDQPSKLILSEHHGAWIFDKLENDFRPLPDLAKVADVKAISIQKASGKLAYIKAETSWWSERVYLLDPLRHISFPGAHLYKVRWINYDE